MAQHNRNISAAIHKLEDANQRRTFFLGFSQSPVDFINGLIASQVRLIRGPPWPSAMLRIIPIASRLTDASPKVLTLFADADPRVLRSSPSHRCPF